MPRFGGHHRSATNPPQITTVAPAAGDTGIAVTRLVRATFNQAMLASTFTTATMLLKDHLGNAVTGTVSYDPIAVRGSFDPVLDLTAGETYTATVKGGASGVKNLNSVAMPSDYMWSFTVVATAPPPGPAPGLVIVGYGVGTTGGGNVGDPGTTLYTPSTYAAFKSALQASGARIVRPSGSVNMDCNGETLNITNGNLTIDGTDYHGIIKRLDLVCKASNVIFTQLRLAVTDQVTNVGDGSSLELNPSIGNTLDHIVIDHCSLMWSPDVILAVLNTVTDVSIQYSLFGPALYLSANPTSPNGYGCNNTTIGSNPNPGTEYGNRITYYRNFIHSNERRNLRAHGPASIEFVNNVVYNWGDKAATANPRGANYVGNMFKRGPNTVASNEVYASELFGAYNSYFANSVYWSTAGVENNIGLGFTPTTSFAAGVRRTARYGTGGVMGTVQAATAALAAAIVEASGPTFTGTVDREMKDSFTNDTGRRYNGAGLAAPNPYFPPF